MKKINILTIAGLSLLIGFAGACLSASTPNGTTTANTANANPAATTTANTAKTNDDTKSFRSTIR